MMLSFISELVLTAICTDYNQRWYQKILHSFLYVICHYILVVSVDKSQSSVQY